MTSVLEKQSLLSIQHQDASGASFADHEMLEMVLCRAVPPTEVRSLAKAVLTRFGSFADAITASPLRLAEVEGMSPRAISEFKLLEAAVLRFTRETMKKRLPLGSLREVVDYCRVIAGFEDREGFRVLFLDKKWGLIADELVAVGTVDHAPVYPREVIRRALELSASGLIIVHNHPSGDPTPSTGDVTMTKAIIAAAEPLGLKVLDHFIVGRQGHASLKLLGLI